MEGMAKSAVINIPTIQKSEHSLTGISTYDYDGVPIDILRFFNVDLSDIPRKDRDQLAAISKWALKDAETLGQGMKRLRDLEIKLGSPRLDETRAGRLYNWVKLQYQIDDLRQRQEAVSG
jgi:hypothetical protein